MKLGSGSAGGWAGGVGAPQPLAEETAGAGQAAAKGVPADCTGQASHLLRRALKRAASAGAGPVKWPVEGFLELCLLGQSFPAMPEWYWHHWSFLFFFFFGKKKKSPGLNRSGLSRELLALKTARQDPTWHLSGLPERGQIDKLSSSNSCQAFELNSSRYVK